MIPTQNEITKTISDVESAVGPLRFPEHGEVSIQREQLRILIAAIRQLEDENTELREALE